MDEALYPVDGSTGLPRLTQEEDLQAAMAAAGGGSEPQGDGDTGND